MDNLEHPEHDQYRRWKEVDYLISQALHEAALPPAPRKFEIDCTPKEFAQYLEWAYQLVYWAIYGYPPERLKTDLIRQAARG